MSTTKRPSKESAETIKLSSSSFDAEPPFPKPAHPAHAASAGSGVDTPPVTTTYKRKATAMVKSSPLASRSHARSTSDDEEEEDDDADDDLNFSSTRSARARSESLREDEDGEIMPSESRGFKAFVGLSSKSSLLPSHHRAASLEAESIERASLAASFWPVSAAAAVSFVTKKELEECAALELEEARQLEQWRSSIGRGRSMVAVNPVTAAEVTAAATAATNGVSSTTGRRPSWLSGVVNASKRKSSSAGSQTLIPSMSSTTLPHAPASSSPSQQAGLPQHQSPPAKTYPTFLLPPCEHKTRILVLSCPVASYPGSPSVTASGLAKLYNGAMASCTILEAVDMGQVRSRGEIWSFQEDVSKQIVSEYAKVSDAIVVFSGHPKCKEHLNLALRAGRPSILLHPSNLSSTAKAQVTALATQNGARTMPFAKDATFDSIFSAIVLDSTVNKRNLGIASSAAFEPSLNKTERHDKPSKGCAIS